MATSRVPTLRDGDHLTRDEFERRYAAMTDLKKAELIEGVVHMSSAVRYDQHARPERLLGLWLGFYEVLTPGLLSAGNCSLRLDLDNMPQPDLLLALPERAGGRARVATDGYLEGAPEMILEIAASSASYDLHEKLHAYRRNGVREYVVHRTEDGEIDWFVLEGGAYVRKVADAAGRMASNVFPGLRLDVNSLLQGDLAALRAAVEAACQGPAHAAFAVRVAPRT